MSYSCKILLDSISETGKRLTTFEITFPRIVLAEFNTHRMFSRNSASSRAIPFKKQVEKIQAEPFIPEQFPVNCTGMQPQEYITEENGKEDGAYYDCVNWWLAARDSAIEIAENLSESWAIHKQICNRLLEPFQWHTVIVTATEFSNFFKLRCDENAQYEIRRIADLMYEAYHTADPYLGMFSNIKGMNALHNPVSIQKLKVGEWHCPLVYEEDKMPILAWISQNDHTKGKASNVIIDQIYNNVKKKVSVARCARVSYLQHSGERSIEKDLELFNRLIGSGHWSPTEHIATPLEDPNQQSGNFYGWLQYRKTFKDENCTYFRKHIQNNE